MSNNVNVRDCTKISIKRSYIGKFNHDVLINWLQEMCLNNLVSLFRLSDTHGDEKVDMINFIRLSQSADYIQTLVNEVILNSVWGRIIFMERKKPDINRISVSEIEEIIAKTLDNLRMQCYNKIADGFIDMGDFSSNGDRFIEVTFFNTLIEKLNDPQAYLEYFNIVLTINTEITSLIN